MANQEHLNTLNQGVWDWNKWREDYPDIQPDLSRANLKNAYLSEANLSGTDLSGADLMWASLDKANLSEANLSGARLIKANLSEADLCGAKLMWAFAPWADLNGANLAGADLSMADLGRSTLRGANLRLARLVQTELTNADLSGSYVYGVSAWELVLHETKQNDLVITRHDEPQVTVDNLEVAQFIHLLLHNEKIRQVIDTITSKVVLILGRFTEDRNAVLNAIREELRYLNFTPILFDFAKPARKDLTGTVETLARMARFIIADLTDPSSIPHELATIVPLLRTTPVLLLRLKGASGYSMAKDLEAYPWVLRPHEYTDSPSLIRSLRKVIAPAELKASELRDRGGM